MKKRLAAIPKWVPAVLSALLWVGVLILLWEMGARKMDVTKRTPENVLPHLKNIWNALISTKKVAGGKTALGIVMSGAGMTLIRALYGFIAGSVLGFGLALMMKLSGVVERLIFPYLMLIQMIPILGLAPIVLSITGDINVSRIVIAGILTFYPVAANTLAGFNSVEREKYELMYTYAASKGTIYRKVLIPQAIPYFFTGLKIAAPMAITASILVDTLQGDGGLGCILSQSLKHAMSIYVFWIIVFFSAIIGILSSKLMGLLEILVLPNKRRRRARV
ncbi:MAG: ABC transporter permease subunit [Butyrivibrio sp.]|nr:ABC transporter permease subunit [Butyrivibrio sp.]